MSKGPKTHHVVPNPQGGWNVKRGGSQPFQYPPRYETGSDQPRPRNQS